MSDKLSNLEDEIRDMQVRAGVRSPVPENPTELPHTAEEYYSRMLDDAMREGPPKYPHAWDKFVALERHRIETEGFGR